MLRASAAANNIDVDLLAVSDSNRDSGVPQGELLLEFADAVTGNDETALERARKQIQGVMGSGALVQAAAIAANFSMNDRAANAMGIPMESLFLDDSADYRAALGINDYPSACNTLNP